MKYRILILVLIVALVAAGVIIFRRAGSNQSDIRRAESNQPNIILISVDTLRADHLGSYGYERDTSPEMDKLAVDGVRFAKAYAQTSWTLTSHMSIMTSKYPHVHGVETHDSALADSHKTLAEVLSDAGYHTSAFISWFYVSKKYGFDQGFDEFAELLPAIDKFEYSTAHSFKAEKVTDNVLNWLQKKPKDPFFLFVHYFDPHINYAAPAPYDTMFDPDYEGPANGTYDWLSQYIKGRNEEKKTIAPRDLEHVTALYDGEIRYTDTHLGRLIKGIEETVGLDNCLLVLLSDHGEELNEHGSMEGHQWTLYDEVVHVPLIFRFPKKDYARSVVEEGVELIDVAPTILDIAEIPIPSEFQGLSLLEAIKGNVKGVKKYIFAETRRITIKQSVRTARYKMQHTEMGWYEMYDTMKDPGEQKNIFKTSWPVAKLFSNKLRLWRGSGFDLVADGEAKRVTLTQEEIKHLASLGYIKANTSSEKLEMPKIPLSSEDVDYLRSLGYVP